MQSLALPDERLTCWLPYKAGLSTESIWEGWLLSPICELHGKEHLSPTVDPNDPLLNRSLLLFNC